MLHAVDMVIPVTRDARHKRAIGRWADKVPAGISCRGELGPQWKVFEILVLDQNADGAKVFVVFVGLAVSNRTKEVAASSALVHLALVFNFLVSTQLGGRVELLAAVGTIYRGCGQ